MAGASRSIVPILADAGVKAVHWGWNPGCVTPHLPSVLRWLHPETGTELLLMIADSYGGEVTMADSYKGEQAPHVHVPGWDQALVFMYSTDNHAPPTADAIEAYWRHTQAQFPNARIVANSMDSFADKLWAAKETVPLPTYAGEVGDCWLNGAGSDPWQNAAFRAIRLARNEMVADGRLEPNDPALQAFEFRLLVHPSTTGASLAWVRRVGSIRTTLVATT